MTCTRAKPVVTWPGGKTRLLKHILPVLPAHELYCEVFGGGLAVFLAKPSAPLEVINDINGDLVHFYRVVKWHLDPLLDELEFVLNSRQEFTDYIHQPGLTEIQRVARWFIRNKISFGGQGDHFGTARRGGGAALGSRANRLLSIRALNHRLDSVCIERLDWAACIRQYDREGALFFLDPPYFSPGGANYAAFNREDLAAIKSCLNHIAGDWVFTFQDHPDCRQIFAGCRLTPVQRHNGIENRPGRKKNATYAELIITPSSRRPSRRRRPTAPRNRPLSAQPSPPP